MTFAIDLMAQRACGGHGELEGYSDDMSALVLMPALAGLIVLVRWKVVAVDGRGRHLKAM